MTERGRAGVDFWEWVDARPFLVAARVRALARSRSKLAFALDAGWENHLWMGSRGGFRVQKRRDELPRPPP